MENFITNLFAHPSAVLAAAVGVCAAWAITGVAKQWRKKRVAELELNLKRQMLDKGLSPEEIEQVLRASSEGKAEEWYHFSGQEDADKGMLVKMLSDYERTGADIERVLQAFPVPAHAANSAAARIGRAKAVEGMVENERTTEEIVQMLRVFHAADPGSHAAESSFAPDAIQELRS
jgi:hypothetical protein